MILDEAVDNWAFRLGKSRDVVAKKKIEHDILVSYATIVGRKYVKRSGDINSLMGSLVLELEETEEAALPSSQLYGENSLQRTKIDVPKVFSAPQQDSGYIVTSKDGSIPFTYIRPDRFKHRNTNVSKFIQASDTEYYTILDRRIYLYSEAEEIRTAGIYVNPKELALAKRVNDSDPIVVYIDNDLFRSIKQLMIEEYPEYAPLKKEDREIKPTVDAQ